ncbi:actin nucleation-promoting factor WASL-like [Onthophagus taurus]|uniref:actin nucleation-promoting factor WASL-like n=1 Tax=Onthophagus taurus TaxID=166361 RepID=UPI0039BE2E28
MQPQDKKSIENKSSQILNHEENHEIFRMLGLRCKTIATAVVQLYTTHPPSHDRWVKKNAGVLCFVRDNTKRNYFFRLYDLYQKTMVWEQELYNGMEYIRLCSYLHAFEGEKSVYGFNFVCENEATDMLSVVTEKIQSKKRREARNSGEGNNRDLKPAAPIFTNDAFKNTGNERKDKTKRKRNLTKADIGVPKEFRHVSHIGWDKDKGFDVNTSDQTLQQFFKKAGVSEKHLKDEATREFIYDFIEKHGGRDAVEKVIEKKEYPAPKSTPGTPVPPVPPRVAPKAPHTRIAPPPPTSSGQPPPRPQYQPRGGTIPPPPPENAPPAPPPLPPLNDIAPPPPPLPPPGDFNSDIQQPSNLTTTDDPRSALLESIRNKVTLKPVEMVEQKPSSGGGDRDDIFKEIKKGVQLKPVEEREIKPPTPNNECLDLAGALKRALEGRRPVIDSDGSDTDSSSNDDAWDA